MLHPTSLDLIQLISSEFQANANTEIAKGQKAYMKNHFDFFGIKSPLRKQIQKPFLANAYLPPKVELPKIIHHLWDKPQREFHYFSQELAQKFTKKLELKDIELFEFMVTNQSWWDTVDFIAVNLIGPYLQQFPDQQEPLSKKWLASDYLWLQRTALLFQLKYKDEMDTHLLSANIEALLDSKEFFINKAIGWVLREYAKTNPSWVKEFVETHELTKLSRREALKHF